MVQNGRCGDDSDVRGFYVPSARRGDAGCDVGYCSVNQYCLGEAFRVSERAPVFRGDPKDGEAGAVPTRSKEFVNEVLCQVSLRGELDV